jgi:hypothetical protein
MWLLDVTVVSAALPSFGVSRVTTATLHHVAGPPGWPESVNRLAAAVASGAGTPVATPSLHPGSCPRSRPRSLTDA